MAARGESFPVPYGWGLVRSGRDSGASTLLIVAAIAGALAAIALLFYAADYGLEATITSKGNDGGGRFVIATTDIGSIDSKHYLPLVQWTTIQPGNYVVYHVRSGGIEVYSEEGGKQLWPPA